MNIMEMAAWVQAHDDFLVASHTHPDGDAVGATLAATRLLKALTVRVTLAALTLALITWGFYSGQLVSHAPF